MRVRIGETEDSPASRAADLVAATAALREGTRADARVEERRQTVALTRPSEFDLTDLLARVSPANIHPAIESGPPVGDEFC